MVDKTTIVKNPSDLHLCPVGVLCREVPRYKSKISFKVCIATASAKSVLSVLGACVKPGGGIGFACEGPNEEEALGAMVGITEAGLGEQIDDSQKL